MWSFQSPSSTSPFFPPQDLRSLTTGQGEFTMDFHEYVAMPSNEQQILTEKYKLSRMSEAEMKMKEREEKKDAAKKEKFG